MIDLHGRLDLVRCMACSATTHRADFQYDLGRLNAGLVNLRRLHYPTAMQTSNELTSRTSPCRLARLVAAS